MDKKIEIKMKCLFCFSTDFILPDENYQPKPGEMVQCANCGKMNDYDSLIRIVKREGMEVAENEAKEIIDGFMKKIEKDWKI